MTRSCIIIVNPGSQAVNKIRPSYARPQQPSGNAKINQVIQEAEVVPPKKNGVAPAKPVAAVEKVCFTFMSKASLAKSTNLIKKKRLSVENLVA